ncbi:MAG TPA: DUF2149 domain-containing protein [Solirubrobacterales bacterium]|jgi:hypothetical protein|nr:DUF2149 domain-containing protein [Solirubrobacterales bacterium]HMU25937.1 DUF2149 domain-containing protein [Solirubrobacterales bacterium]HMW44400.1 DUF2149 domain-containing protein [Solirubrobacterales bacterium]HMX70382.1 DUF2149 domain-containing protein [Solirubrobacterales bacterium]HMY25289.1 DUF2149 domain-containing protein [Solirubrobacterales bacterium]
MAMKVTAKARSREDRAGDPLDGLVNLFDIGIILSVGFLLAALSSLNLTTEALSQNDTSPANTVPENSVVTQPDETTEQITIEPGQTVVGQGEPLGTVYQLDDGRTILVKPSTGTTGATGATGTTGVTGSTLNP